MIPGKDPTSARISGTGEIGRRRKEKGGEKSREQCSVVGLR